VTTWVQIQPATTGSSFLAGTGGVPGGREAGDWVAKNVPAGAGVVSIGPSMANIIQFYGHRETKGLSVSPNPLYRNPVYEPVDNPDLRIRNGEVKYLVWDSYSASRTSFFSDGLRTYAQRYHGQIVHQEFVTVKTSDGPLKRPVITIYELHP
jgi:hypothetical protein